MSKAARVPDTLAHILKAIARIERYTEDMREAMFLSSEMAQDAALRNIEIIGEASNNIRRAAQPRVAPFLELRREASNNIRRAAQRYFPTSHVQDAQSCLAWL